MNKSLTTLSHNEKRALTGFATRDESITLHDLYKMHYTRFGAKRTFYFALRVLNINESTNGKAFKPTGMVDEYFIWSEAANTYRLNLSQRKAFGDSYKNDIRRIMECINDKLEIIQRLYEKDVEYFAQDSTKTNARYLANKIKVERIHKLYNQNTNTCT